MRKEELFKATNYTAEVELTHKISGEKIKVKVRPLALVEISEVNSIMYENLGVKCIFKDGNLGFDLSDVSAEMLVKNLPKKLLTALALSMSCDGETYSLDDISKLYSVYDFSEVIKKIKELSPALDLSGIKEAEKLPDARPT